MTERAKEIIEILRAKTKNIEVHNLLDELLLSITAIYVEAPSKDNSLSPDKGVGIIATKSKKSQVVRSKVPNDLEEVYAFGAELKLPRVECEKFWLHFENNGWKQSGKTPMKDWKLALRNWRINWCERSGKDPDFKPKPKIHRLIEVEDAPIDKSDAASVFSQKMSETLKKLTGGE